MKRQLLFLFLIGLFLSVFNVINAQNGPAKKMVGHYHYKYVVPYKIKQGPMIFSETGTMDFYKDGHGLDSARQVYQLVTEEKDTVYWTFNYVNQNNWRVDGDTVIYSGTPETFIFELLDLQVTNPALEKWAREYGNYILTRIRETISETEKFTIAKLNRRCLFLARPGLSGAGGMLEFYKN